MGKKKTKSKKSLEWNLVPVGEEMLNSKDMENFVSLEVLTDYKIVKKSDGMTEIINTAKSKPRGKGAGIANTEQTMDDEELDTDEDDSDKDVNCDFPGSSSEEEEITDDDEEIEDSQDDTENENDDGSEEDEDIEEENGVVDDGNDSDNEIVEPTPKKMKTTKDNKQAVREGSRIQLLDDDTKTNKKSKNNKNKKIPAQKAGNDSDNTLEEEISRTSQCSEDSNFNLEAWENLGVRDPILQSLKSSSFNEPTTIQAMTLPAALLGKKDIVGAAETGSGKTLAFVIPIIHGILKHRENKKDKKHQLQALILTPTRELAVQIKKHFDVAASGTDVKSVVIVGGLATQKQERLLKRKPDVVIATPGRLWELCREGEPHLATVDSVRFLAIDETDRMVEKGHFEELQGLLELLNNNELSKKCRQNFVFSATLSFTHDPPKRLTNKKKPPKKISTKDKLKQIMEMVGVRENPKVVDITSSKGTCETLQEMQINCPANKKDCYMYYFLMKHPGRTIVFCNSINTVRRLTNLFYLLKCGQVLPLHSEMHQKMRLKNLERFAENDRAILIATDVAARGLDITDIQHVVHYEIPKTAESYIHRSGRTARAFKGGIAVVLVEPSEIGKLKQIFRSLKRDPNKMLPLFSVDTNAFNQLKHRIDEADKVEKFEHSVKKKLADMNWMEKAKKDMDLASSDDDEESGEKRQKKTLKEAKKKLDILKKNLDKLLEDDSFLL